MRTLLIVLATGLALMACKSSKSITYTEKELEDFENFVNAQDMEFVAQWAMPLTSNALNQISNAGLLPPGSNAARINLIGNPNFLRIQGDSVSAKLPYYGERQIGSTYGSQNTGIVFNGQIENLSIKKNEKKASYQYSFDISENTETYQVNMTIHSNLSTVVRINSSQRFAIGYQGQITPIEEKLLK